MSTTTVFADQPSVPTETVKYSTEDALNAGRQAFRKGKALGEFPPWCKPVMGDSRLHDAFATGFRGEEMIARK
ncbi:MAG: hypothetical protein EXS51_02210 [Candidatus Taylorbacteria bacterium]|nr:hypothetical protein [Candidatus Taylorbacteria bacterium]